MATHARTKRPSTKINAKNLLKWIEDLETTDEPQGAGMLCSDGAFCCLGRLCEVAVADGVPVVVTDDIMLKTPRRWYSGEIAFAPNIVTEWLGVCSSGSIGILTESHGTRDPVGANDHLGLTFREIAAGLRKYYADQLAELEELALVTA